MEADYSFPIGLSAEEKELVRPFFTNTDKHVFALINLPEVIKGTLFSRYSRSDKGVRRLLIDEFMPNKDVASAMDKNKLGKELELLLDINRAEDFYQRILVGFGDDSVAELAGAHIACENISSLAGDFLTDSRIGISPLEKSARYILFDKKIDGKYLWFREPNLMNSKFADLYVKTMDTLFDNYAKWIPLVMQYIREVSPRTDDTTERAYASATKAKACDILKNILPAGRLTNVGLFGNGRAFEYMLTKFYSSELPEVTRLAKEMHEELAKVIPSFVKRSQVSEYLVDTRNAMKSFAAENLPKVSSKDMSREPYLKMADYDPEGETNVLAGMLYAYSSLPLEQLQRIVKSMSNEKRNELVTAYLSKRRNRRDKAGRALENLYYVFEMCASYGVFRDMHRHRILTLDKQRLTTDLGFDVPKELEYVGLDKDYKEALLAAAEVQKKVEKEMPIEAQYLVPRSFHMRWYMKLTLREVYHFTELRSGKQGHPDYRKIAQQMKMQIEKVHPALVRYMQVDMNDYALPRLESEKRIDKKLAELDTKAESANKG